MPTFTAFALTHSQTYFGRPMVEIVFGDGVSVLVECAGARAGLVRPGLAVVVLGITPIKPITTLMSAFFAIKLLPNPIVFVQVAEY